VITRPAPGTRFPFRWRKWDGSPHWEHECVMLGSDEWGDWVGQLAGWRSVRPGRDLLARAANVSLIPPSGTWCYTRNLAPTSARIYIDIAWDLRWENDLPTGIDMDLDVVRRDPGQPYIEDRDEWDEHRVHYGYPPHIVTELESVAIDLERRVRAQEAPFDDATAAHWFTRLDDLTSRPSGEDTR